MNSLGEYLVTARKNRDLERESLSSKTKIPLKILIALEENNPDILPKPVFVRGFIKILCKELKIDSNDALELYEKFLKHEKEPLQNPMLLDTILTSRESGSSLGETNDIKFTYLFIILLFLLSVILAVFALGPSNNTNEKATQADSINSPQ